MNLVKLSPLERKALKQKIQGTKEIKLFKRSLALIKLSEGFSVTQISKDLGVTRKTIYNWINNYKKRTKYSLDKRLSDLPHSGRPAEKSNIITAAIDQLLQETPEKHGYYYSDWTAPLLHKHIQTEKKLELSIDTVRRCIKRLGYVWKRPRYTLSRQSPTWRQEKGGSNEVLEVGQDLSSP